MNKLKEIADSLVWSSANPSVATVEAGYYLIKENATELMLVAKVTGNSRGKTDITVSAPDGSKVSCHVVVEKSTDSVEEPRSTF